jgi:hypothetical protein
MCICVFSSEAYAFSAGILRCIYQPGFLYVSAAPFGVWIRHKDLFRSVDLASNDTNLIGAWASVGLTVIEDHYSS